MRTSTAKLGISRTRSLKNSRTRSASSTGVLMNIADVKEVRDVVVLWNDGEIARWEACSLVADCIVRNANATLDGFDEGLRLDIIEWLKGLARVESAADVVTWSGRPEV